MPQIVQKNSKLFIVLSLCACQVDAGEGYRILTLEGAWSIGSSDEGDSLCGQGYEAVFGEELWVGQHQYGARSMGPTPFPATVDVANALEEFQEVQLTCDEILSQSGNIADSIYCTGITPFLIHPFEGLEAAWPLSIELGAQFNQKGPCGTSDDDSITAHDYAGFVGDWRVELSGSCEGMDCDEAQSMVEASEGICIQGPSVTAQWSGCGDEGAYACRDYFEDIEQACRGFW